jgi:hypothetical protein
VPVRRTQNAVGLFATANTDGPSRQFAITREAFDVRENQRYRNTSSLIVDPETTEKVSNSIY